MKDILQEICNSPSGERNATDELLQIKKECKERKKRCIERLQKMYGINFSYHQ